MFSYSKVVEIKAPVKQVYEILVGFTKHRKFRPPELKKVKIISQTKTNAEVNFTVKYLITTDFTLEYKLIPNRSIKWKLIEGAIFKKNSGSLKLTSLGKNLTRTAINAKVEFSFFIPSLIFERKLLETGPIMILIKIAEKSGIGSA
jgi:uncharacterized membrane protein